MKVNTIEDGVWADGRDLLFSVSARVASRSTRLGDINLHNSFAFLPPIIVISNFVHRLHTSQVVLILFDMSWILEDLSLPPLVDDPLDRAYCHLLSRY